MKRIEVDFNVGQDPDGLMRLVGALPSLKALSTLVGETVLLYQDQDIGVKAVLVERDGVVYARFDWDDIQDWESLLLGRDVTRYHYQVTTHAVHSLCTWNRVAIERSVQCGCFCCGAIFRPSEIKEWIDPVRKGKGYTALCPRCGIDSVLADACIELTPELLAEMEKIWFGMSKQDE